MSISRYDPERPGPSSIKELAAQRKWDYLDFKATRAYLGLNVKDWSLHHRKLPWITYEGKDIPFGNDLSAALCSFLELKEIKRKMSPRYYLLKAEMIRETRIYYELFDERIKDLKIPTFKHPFNTRILYRTSDIPIIKRGYHE